MQRHRAHFGDGARVIQVSERLDRPDGLQGGAPLQSLTAPPFMDTRRATRTRGDRGLAIKRERPPHGYRHGRTSPWTTELYPGQSVTVELVRGLPCLPTGSVNQLEQRARVSSPPDETMGC